MLYFVVELILFFNLVAIISIIFIEKKNPTSALAWIIVLNFLPLIGFILYFFLGSSQKLRLIRKIYKLDAVEKDILEEISRDTKIKKLNKLDDLFVLNDYNFLNTVTNDSDIKVYSDMNEAVGKMFKDMLNAKKTIHVSFFIFNTKSDVGRKFLEILKEKAKSGVKVRFTYDRLGSLKSRFKDFKEIIKYDGEVYKHLPSLFRTLFQSNYRNHRKMVIIDSKIAYTGGMNISDEYLNHSKKIKPWRDTWAKIEGSSVLFIQSKFLVDFIYLKKLTLKRKYDENKTKKEIKEIFYPVKFNGNDTVQFVYNGPDTEYSYIRDGYLKMINDAKKSIYIVTPYFIPDEPVLEAIRLASISGVDVQVLIPGLPDKKNVYYVTLSFITKLVECGVKVYMYDGFVHSKIIICDNEYLSFGTCNFDSRSFRLNYENNLFIKSKKTAKSMIKDFENDIKKSKQFTKKDIKIIGKLKTFIGLICRLFSPIL